MINIELRQLAGIVQETYVLEIIESKKCFIVPVQHADIMGIRRTIGKFEILKIYDILKELPNPRIKRSFSMQHAVYTNKIKSENIFDIAEVWRDLKRMGSYKKLSFGTKRVLEKAEKLLLEEMAFAQNLSKETVLSQLETLIAS